MIIKKPNDDDDVPWGFIFVKISIKLQCRQTAVFFKEEKKHVIHIIVFFYSLSF